MKGKNSTSKTLMIAHNQWANRPADQRFTSLDSLREFTESRRTLCREAVKDITDLHAEVILGGFLI